MRPPPRRPYTAEQLATCDQRIARTCFPAQLDYVFDPALFVSSVVGRGGGKTVAKLLRLIRAMMRTPDANCFFFAGTRQSAERIVWRDLKRVVSESLRLANAKFSEQRLELVLPNGSKLGLLGADDKADINKLRGITYHAVEIDESATIRIDLIEELIVEVIGPRLIGYLGLGGTPGKELRGPFYEATRDGGDQHRPYRDRELPEYADWKRWSSHHWDIEDGVAAGVEAMAIIHAKQLETKAREGWSDSNPYWLREYKGRWIPDASSSVYAYRPHDEHGHEFNQWTPARDSFGLAVLPAGIKDWGFGIGIDVGWKDAFALEVAAWSYSDPSRRIYQVYEIYRGRVYAKALATLLLGEELSHVRYGGLFGRIGWPDVLVGDFAGAGGALLEELAVVYGIKVVAADKPYRYKENAIELENSDLFEGRHKITKGSALASEMTALQWEVDQFGRRAENKGQPNHACDAWLYLGRAIAPLLPAVSTAPPGAPPAARTQRPEPDDPPPAPELERRDPYGDAGTDRFEPGDG